MLIPKDKAYRNEKLRRAVASLPCQSCGLEGSTQASHSNQLRDGRGVGHKTSDAMLAALCQSCHYQIDYGKDMSRAEKLDMWERAYRKTMRALIERELLVVNPKAL
jgi:endonuclease III-like uncharacterized protein